MTDSQISMKTLSLVAILGASLFIGASTGAHAQTADSAGDFPLGLLLPRTAGKVSLIKLKYANSASIAYRLDPANNLRPAILGAEASPKSTEDVAFTLPEGIEQIVSVDPQNVLLISYKEGSEQSVRDLQALIAVLDQPLRQIELEAQVVEMSPEDAKTFGIDFGPQQNETNDAKPDGETKFTPQIGVMKNFSARLNALVADNKAKILGTPRVAVANNFPGQLTLSVPRTLTLTAVAGSDPPATLNYVTKPELVLNVVPILNGDETLSFEIDVTSNATPEKGVTSSKSLLKSTLNLRDGDTWALKNLPFPVASKNYKVPLLGDIPFIGKLFQAKSELPQETLVFITARIIRRAEDVEAKPAN